MMFRRSSSGHQETGGSARKVPKFGDFPWAAVFHIFPVWYVWSDTHEKAATQAPVALRAENKGKEWMHNIWT